LAFVAVIFTLNDFVTALLFSYRCEILFRFDTVWVSLSSKSQTKVRGPPVELFLKVKAAGAQSLSMGTPPPVRGAAIPTPATT